MNKVILINVIPERQIILAEFLLVVTPFGITTVLVVSAAQGVTGGLILLVVKVLGVRRGRSVTAISVKKSRAALKKTICRFFADRFVLTYVLYLVHGFSTTMRLFAID